MAEMDTSSGGGHKKGPGVKKGKKLSTRVDLTPMVDLGFLLITFFIFTTTMSQPTAFKLILPKEDVKDEDKNRSSEEGTITILPSKDNHLYYYEGNLKPDGSNFLSASYAGENSIRSIILKKKADLTAKFGNDDKMVIVIKPYKDAVYKNLVDILDEMQINIAKRYALVTPHSNDIKLIELTDNSVKK
ncbi:MAG: biopolymer transporter ExbD [Sediminibacterium sp.]|nr:biopolymer transporter ExbD [Sediminibacterium sp.]